MQENLNEMTSEELEQLILDTETAIETGMVEDDDIEAAEDMIDEASLILQERDDS